MLTEANDHWSGEEFVSMMMVDLESGSAERFELPPSRWRRIHRRSDEVDGKVYISVYRDGLDRTELFAVTTAGAEPAFPTVGDVLFMGRAR